MSEKELANKLVKLARIEAVTKTYTEMLKLHPGQKKILDAVLMAKLENINNG